MRDIASEFVEGYNQFEKGITNINSFAKFPSSFLKLINHRKHKFIVDSFCDTNLYNPDVINKIFDGITSLSSENISEKIEIQKKLIKLISSYLASIKKVDRTYIENITVISCLEKLITILQENLPEEHKVRIADLIIEDIERKYSFHKIDDVFEIKFKIVNFGGGEALNTIVKLECDHPHLQILNQEIHLGEIQTHTIVISHAICSQNIEENFIPLKIETSWNDFEGKNKNNSKEILLLQQNSNIDWETQKNPYSLDAVKGKADFIGRKEIIKKILSNYEKDTFESSIITGQKRVGKSSIGRAIETILSEKDKHIVIYISVNDLDNQRADTFINSFGDTIYSELKYHLEKLDYKLPETTFAGSLFPLLNALKNIKRDMSLRKDVYKLIFIVDEFDEIPIQIINNTEIGNAFFQNIRSLIDKREYTEFLGLILIGGENMGFIHQSTQRLNKFNLHSVDYFDKEKYWTDFVELVTKPAINIIEYSPDLLDLLYELTEGNPFYTNLLCKHLFDYGKTNKISYLTDSHLENILSEKLVEMGTLHFSHFWLDYILEEDKVKKDNLETQRRKFLIAYSQLKRDNKQISDNNLSKMKILENVSIPKILESFVNRKVFVPIGSQEYRFKPKFAEKWLIEYGCHELMSSFTNEEAVQIYIEKERDSYVSDKEILSFIEHSNLSAYRSRPVEVAHIRNWLNQFDDNQERRLIFNLLSKIKYYDDFKIREKIRTIHKTISKNLPPIILEAEDTSRQRKDIIISGFDRLGKSTPLYARIYRQENDILPRNIVFSNKLKQIIINSSQNIKAIVFIDDIIGSGGTIVKEMKNINEEIGSLLAEKKINIYITAIVGYQKGIQNIKNSLNNFLHFDFEIYCPNEILENETCNACNSTLYEDKAEQEKTIEIIKKYHQRLNLISYDFTPFGYSDDGLLVAFNEACPN